MLLFSFAKATKKSFCEGAENSHVEFVNSQLLLFQTCAHWLAWAAAQVIVEDDEDEEIWFDAVDSNVEISIEVKMNISDGHLYLKDDDLGQVLAVVEDAVEVRIKSNKR